MNTLKCSQKLIKSKKPEAGSQRHNFTKCAGYWRNLTPIPRKTVLVKIIILLQVSQITAEFCSHNQSSSCTSERHLCSLCLALLRLPVCLELLLSQLNNSIKLTFPQVSCIVLNTCHLPFVMYDNFCWVEGVCPLFHWWFCIFQVVFGQRWHIVRSNENLKTTLTVQIARDSDNWYLDTSSYVIISDPLVVLLLAGQVHIQGIVAEAVSGGKDPELVDKDPATLSVVIEDYEGVPIPEM